MNFSLPGESVWGENRKNRDVAALNLQLAWMKASGTNGYDGVLLNQVKALTFSSGKVPAEGNPGCCLEKRKQ